MSGDHVTLNDLWDHYDERPKRVSAIRLTPDNLADVAQAFVWGRGIKASVDFKNHTLTLSTADGDITANIYDFIVYRGDGVDVIPGSEFRSKWRKFGDEADW